MMLAGIIGTISAILTTTAFLPQVIKVFKTKQIKDLSYGMLLMQSTGNFMWIIYGFMIDSMSLAVANIITFLLVLSLVIAKSRYH
ncbi:MAG: SemiSWEET transporter [Gammaproteobacteria bacterium]|nr:SemiSWEET transporter [Gammaproteobacteria bacterium]